MYESVRIHYRIDTLKDDGVAKAYRNFCWKLGIDSTKTRPSGEVLLRRVLNGNELPNISVVVDAYNLASMETIVPIGGFDADLLTPPFHLRFTWNEAFSGIGTTEMKLFAKKMLVLTDEKQILCVYPHRDSDHTKINPPTQNAVIVGYGTPGITQDNLKMAVKKTLAYIKNVSDRKMLWMKVYGIQKESRR